MEKYHKMAWVVLVVAFGTVCVFLVLGWYFSHSYITWWNTHVLMRAAMVISVIGIILVTLGEICFIREQKGESLLANGAAILAYSFIIFICVAAIRLGNQVAQNQAKLTLVISIPFLVVAILSIKDVWQQSKIAS